MKTSASILFSAILAIALLFEGNSFARADNPPADPQADIFACVNHNGKVKKFVTDAAKCKRRQTAISLTGIAAQTCAEGEFVSGVDETGAIICGASGNGEDPPAPVQCPCKFDVALAPIPIGQHWPPGLDANLFGAVAPTSGICLLDNLNPENIDTWQGLETQFIADTGVGFCKIYTSGPATNATIDDLSEEEFYACNRDINAYSRTLDRATDITVVGLDNPCPESPNP